MAAVAGLESEQAYVALGNEEAAVVVEEDAAAPALAWTLARLCSVGFFFNFQPSEPFLTYYLEHGKHLSSDALNARVWPCDTYGALAFTIPAALLAERIGYWRALVVGAGCREATRLLLLYGRGVDAMAAMQLTYAGAIAAHDAVYVAHALAAVPPRARSACAAAATAACKAGDALGSLAGQCLRGWGGEAFVPVETLFYVSWASTTVGVGCLLLVQPRARGGDPPPRAAGAPAARVARAVLADPSGRA